MIKIFGIAFFAIIALCFNGYCFSLFLKKPEDHWLNTLGLIVGIGLINGVAYCLKNRKAAFVLLILNGIVSVFYILVALLKMMSSLNNTGNTIFYLGCILIVAITYFSGLIINKFIDLKEMLDA